MLELIQAHTIGGKGKYEPRAETARKIYNALSSQKKERQVLE